MQNINILFAIVTAFLWGFGAVLEKMILTKITPLYMFILTGLLYGLVCVVYLIFYHKHIVGEYHKTKAVVPLYLILTICLISTVVPMLTYFVAFERIKHNAHIVTAICFSAPLFTVMCLAITGHETLTLTSLFGVALIIIGTVIIILTDVEPVKSIKQ